MSNGASIGLGNCVGERFELPHPICPGIAITALRLSAKPVQRCVSLVLDMAS
jgi:hypothetical protein